MTSDSMSKRFHSFGDFLREKRGKSRSVRELAHMLGVSASFLYQVEEGWKKPKRDKLEQWASVYDVPSIELYKLTYQLPFPMTKTQAMVVEGNNLQSSLANLTEAERREVEEFADFLAWKKQQSAA